MKNVLFGKVLVQSTRAIVRNEYQEVGRVDTVWVEPGSYNVCAFFGDLTRVYVLYIGTIVKSSIESRVGVRVVFPKYYPAQIAAEMFLGISHEPGCKFLLNEAWEIVCSGVECFGYHISAHFSLKSHAEMPTCDSE